MTLRGPLALGAALLALSLCLDARGEDAPVATISVTSATAGSSLGGQLVEGVMRYRDQKILPGRRGRAPAQRRARAAAGGAAIISSIGALNGWTLMLAQVPMAAAQVPYVFCSVVEAVLFLTRKPLSRALRIGPFMPVSLAAFVFALGTIYGAGASAGMWSLILILLAAPIWVYLAEARETSD